MQRIKAQVRRSGVWRLLDVFALRLYYRIAHATRDRQFEQDTVRAIVKRFGAAPAVPVFQASSVNAPETIAFLEGCRPDFVIARCKTLLKPAVFQVPSQGTYVLHPGICPEYRNARGCFWALSSG